MDESIPIYIGSSCKNSFVIADLRAHDLTRSEKIDFATKATSLHDVDSCLFILTSKHADIKMEIFERDGSQSDTCGNGMLLITHFLEIKTGKIETNGGTFDAHCDEQSVSVHMGVRSVKVAGFEHDTSFLYIKSGEPHLVSLVENIDDVDLHKMGEDFQAFFTNGVNVNLLEKINSCSYKIRTYERGVLNVTKSCGTGSLSSYTATSFINGETNTEMIELKSIGGSHWVSREGGQLKLKTLRDFCVINSLDNSGKNGI